MRELTLVLALLLTSAASAQTTITIGETTILSNLDNGNGNLLVTQQATLPQQATIDSLSFYVSRVSGQLQLGIYDASGPNGGPGARLAVTAKFPTVRGWNTRSVVTPVELAAGTYWISYLPSSNGLNFEKQNDTGPCQAVTHSFSSGMPSRWPSGGFDCTPTTWSFYATLTPTGPPPPPPPVNGQCGAEAGVPSSTAPTTDLCVAGSASVVTSDGTNWNWTCGGMNGGTSAACQAPVAGSPPPPPPGGQTFTPLHQYFLSPN